ncbi:hypothetical protein OG21DRAFT_1498132 [Imleria badia]|nr:hypothetical protein OG21DRAFT_1498132 [Imleria badia]
MDPLAPKRKNTTLAGPHLLEHPCISCPLSCPTFYTSEMSSSMSPVIKRTQPRNSRFQSTIDRPVEWPLEHFPQPPLDGYWIPKFAPPPPSKFSPPLPSVPSNLSLDPPIIALTYPPPPPLTAEDPTWLDQMLADVTRQRSHLERCLSEAQADVTNAYAEAGLADAELEEERAKMQGFLNMVAKVAGTGFVRRMLEDVGHSVEVMSKPPGNDDDSGYNSTSPSSGSAHSASGPAV